MPTLVNKSWQQILDIEVYPMSYSSDIFFFFFFLPYTLDFLICTWAIGFGIDTFKHIKNKKVEMGLRPDRQRTSINA